MTRATRLRRLEQVTELLRDSGLAELQRAAAKRDALLARRAALTPGPVEADGPAPLRAAALHEQWCMRERARINGELAVATAEWMRCRDAAARAVGRAQAVHNLSRKLSQGR
ncbi:hypothetical protein C2I36_10680 [Rhodobacteraceae bacterium WD3A24]|nr:hypothetical protein C2I36_10680 [Rhodobacteraceae bacterium WD3A24]